MLLPNLEVYLRVINEDPKKIFKDFELQRCTVEKNALQVPKVRTGNFASIFKYYSAEKMFGVRCFLKMPKNIKSRYSEIAKTTDTSISKDHAKTFIRFEYLEEGILVDHTWFPVLKMEWAEGETLGEFINREFRNVKSLINLKNSLQWLKNFLQRSQCAHGDIQPGNLIILNKGKDIKLIDYDGMYVNDLDHSDSFEVGHKNFQHPGRSEKYFSKNLDWFSFIQLEVAISALIENSNLWEETYSDEEGIIFRSGDLKDPLGSETFHKISLNAKLSPSINQFAEVCLRGFEKIPDPDLFYKKHFQELKYDFQPKKIKQSSVIITKNKDIPYDGEYPVVDGNDRTAILNFIGKRIEIIGQIITVSVGKKQFGNSIRLAPYIYLNFSSISAGEVFRVKFLPDVIEGSKLSSLLPCEKWAGKWITITETVQPQQLLTHPSFKSGLHEVSVIVKNLNQVKVIDKSEALYRKNQKEEVNQKNFRATPQLPKRSSLRNLKNKNVLDVLKKM